MGCKVGLRRFSILLWKNFMLKKRHYLQTIFEIIIPTALFTAIVAIHVKGGESVSPKQMDIVYNRTQAYPVEFCSSLIEHTYNGTLSNRTLSYTNCPSELDECLGENGSMTTVNTLVHDLMLKVQQTVENFLVPSCIEAGGVLIDLAFIYLENKNFTFNATDEELGVLSKFCTGVGLIFLANLSI